jgi:hypothetical protein
MKILARISPPKFIRYGWIIAGHKMIQNQCLDTRIRGHLADHRCGRMHAKQSLSQLGCVRHAPDQTMLKFPTYRGSLRALPIDLPETRRPIGLITLQKRELSAAAKLFAKSAREIVRPLATAT